MISRQPSAISVWCCMYSALSCAQSSHMAGVWKQGSDGASVLSTWEAVHMSQKSVGGRQMTASARRSG